MRATVACVVAVFGVVVLLHNELLESLSVDMQGRCLSSEQEILLVLRLGLLGAFRRIVHLQPLVNARILGTLVAVLGNRASNTMALHVILVKVEHLHGASGAACNQRLSE